MRANADTPHDARVARGFGAEGIGLCRTEHMFFEGDRINAMREMIVARDEAGRRRALAKLLPMQRADFEGIFEAMNGLPVTIRLLDPPLHEFLPHGGEESKLLARTLGLAREELDRASSNRYAKRTPCSGIAGAGSASRIPRSPKCRAARSSRPPFGRNEEASTYVLRSWFRSSPRVGEFENQRAILEEAARSSAWCEWAKRFPTPSAR